MDTDTCKDDLESKPCPLISICGVQTTLSPINSGARTQGM